MTQLEKYLNSVHTGYRVPENVGFLHQLV